MTQSAQLIYFSPTGTTRKVLTAIAEGLGASDIQQQDLTRAEESLPLQGAEGLTLIGIPVYAGRVPAICRQRFSGLQGNGQPAILVAVYGNREFEDALVELRDLVSAAGFNILAAAAFIGEHSYATEQAPIALGRPDADDLASARNFGRDCAAKLAANEREPVAIPGNVPYRDGVKLGGIAPETDPAICTLCGRCAAVCPTFVISLSDGQVITDAQGCVICCACTKDCPTAARTIHHPVVEERRALLLKNCREPKQPQLFL